MTVAIGFYFCGNKRCRNLFIFQSKRTCGDGLLGFDVSTFSSAGYESPGIYDAAKINIEWIRPVSNLGATTSSTGVHILTGYDVL